MEGPVRPLPRGIFNREALRERYRSLRDRHDWAQGTHFWDPDAPWNQALV